jgi:murein DD-endopeptidase MepM/ murein hydrolase activator NlpD
VRVDHADGSQSVYIHMQMMSALSENDLVLPGMVVGRVGQTGSATGPHLHFALWGEQRCSGCSYDPELAFNWDC